MATGDDEHDDEQDDGEDEDDDGDDDDDDGNHHHHRRHHHHHQHHRILRLHCHGRKLARLVFVFKSCVGRIGTLQNETSHHSSRSLILSAQNPVSPQILQANM